MAVMKRLSRTTRGKECFSDIAVRYLRRGGLRRPFGSPRLANCWLRRLCWSAVRIADTPAIEISSQNPIPTRVIMTLHPQTVTRGADGSYIFDMGQNIVGWATLKVKGDAGTRVHLRFAEILKPDGTIYTENLRNADATDVYVLKGGGARIVHTTFYVSWFPLRCCYRIPRRARPARFIRRNH